MVKEEMVANSTFQPILFTQMTPTWELLEFNTNIPHQNPGPENRQLSSTLICGTVIKDRLVYRVFERVGTERSEVYRIVFYRDLVTRETRDHVWGIVSASSLTETKAKDITGIEGGIQSAALFEALKNDVDITNKASLLRIIPYVKKSYSKLEFLPFLEAYIKTRHTEGKTKGVPERIVRELYGRNHNNFCAVRIDKDLVVVTGEKCCKYLTLKEQTRVYFDASRPYYFIKNVATGFWEQEDISRQFLLEREVEGRLIDKDLFNKTCVEKYAEHGVSEEWLKNDRITYGSLMAQVGFLCAEQAAKTDSGLYRKVLRGIFGGYIKDGNISLPELFGITGPQLKYLKGIQLPEDFSLFGEMMRDEEFIEHFPDVKKRIFAVSLYLSFSMEYRRQRGLTRNDVFLASGSICSLERYEGEKRYLLVGELVDYMIMRKRFLNYKESMREDDPLRQIVLEYGDPPANVKPSRIRDAHNKLGNVLSIISRKKTIEECDRDIIFRKEKEAKDIEYTNGLYSILMPRDAQDIIREGRNLHHCVGHGGYIEAMARRECRILFLRDNLRIGESLITIEERDGIIRQCYGFADSINQNERIRDFIVEYAKGHGFKIEAVIYHNS